MHNQMIFGAGIAAILVGLIQASYPTTSQEYSSCYNSFADFAYRAPLLDRERMEQILLPAWTVEANVPTEGDLLAGKFIEPVLSTRHQEQPELWLRYFTSFQAPNQNEGLLLYKVQSREWEFIPSQIESTEVFVDQLFTVDNRVWGRTNWNPQRQSSSLQYVPVLAVFDEAARRFKFASGVPQVPFQMTSFTSNPVRFLLDNQDTFWIFNVDRGIYQYIPKNHVSTQVSEVPTELVFPYSIVTSTAISPDNHIYFETFSTPLAPPFFRSKKNTLYRFMPEMNLIEALELPQDDWPIFSGLLVDTKNRLWLGSIGYRTENGEWRLLHPDTTSYFNLVDEGAMSGVWAPVRLIYESSDGRLWFNRFQDTGGWVDGTAWYDPETGEGCQFTNIAANIIEDDQGTLWMVANGVLYSHTLPD
jgi:hypothetical protein